MTPSDIWYDRPLERRAPAGGLQGVDGRVRRGGEFEPFYVPRAVMPQVEEADYPDLLRHATTQGVIVRLCEREPHHLKFHQRVDHMDYSLIDETKLAKPILTSVDGFILDGNHRAKGNQHLGRNVHCIELGLEFKDAIGFLFSLPNTTVIQHDHD